MNLDSVDLKILGELARNAKSSFVEIGKRLHLHPNVVAYRINKMEQLGIIREYTVILDFEKLGLSEQIFVGVSFPGNAERDKVLEEIAAIPQTIKVISSLGNPESIVFLVGRNKAEIDKVITKLRNLNVKIEYTGSIIRTYQEGRLSNFLKVFAKELEAIKPFKHKEHLEAPQIVQA